MIRFLLWDVDGTLLDFLAAEKAALRSCFSSFGMGECTERMIADYSAINVSYWKKLERGEMRKSRILVARFEDFFKRYSLDVSLAPAFNEAYQFALGETAVFFPGARETVVSLKGKSQAGGSHQRHQDRADP